ncbi:hypothetical protein PPACK8108_LOCUS16290 [Phakopsora pachyrhizi]|uniref:Uncharacterized protein n=1 Tax=Phakopsora pachyrhizi TaxID=170000 RepID=A0AAV0BA85_PHAPC|nr:hypothetical protein PPACK8108_LOCUS16290 [Phakopsora pachyrhizi]
MATLYKQHNKTELRPEAEPETNPTEFQKKRAPSFARLGPTSTCTYPEETLSCETQDTSKGLILFCPSISPEGESDCESEVRMKMMIWRPKTNKLQNRTEQTVNSSKGEEGIHRLIQSSSSSLNHSQGLIMPIFGGKRKKDINNLDKANSASPPLRDLQSSSNPTRYEPLINPQSILQTSSNNLSQPNNFQQQQQSDIQPSSRPNQQQPSSLSSSSNNIANNPKLSQLSSSSDSTTTTTTTATTAAPLIQLLDRDQASEPNPISLSKSSPPPFPRYGHSVNSMGTPNGSGDLYIFAGLVSDQVKNDLYVLNVNNTNLLPSSSTNNPSIPSSSILNSSAAALHQNQVLTVGVVETRGEVPLPRVGHASTREDQKQDDGLYLLNLSTREWTRVKVSGHKFYIFGGQTDNGSFMNDLWAFDLHRRRVTQLSLIPTRSLSLVERMVSIITMTPGSLMQSLERHSATLVDDVMYVLGGRGVDGKDLDDLAAFKISSKVYVLGGESYTSSRPDDPSIFILSAKNLLKPCFQLSANSGRTKSEQPNSERSTTGPSNNVPVRPRRDDDPISNNAPNGGIINRRTMAAGPSASPQSQIDNASLDSSYISHSNLGPNSKPPRPLTSAPLHQSVIQQQQQQQARQTSSPLLAGRSSSEANRLTNNMSPPMARQTRGSPNDSNLTGASPLGSSKDQARLLQLQKNNVWMKAALAMAVKQGFALPESDDLVKPSDGNLDMNDKAWLEKFQIDDKGSGGLKNRNQTKMLDDRFTEVNRAKTVALQEASFYRVKLAAYEASSVSEINKLERERISDLEHKLSEIISCKSGLERQVNQLTNELEHERTLRELSEENAQKSHERSQEIEALHSRSLVDYEELLNKTKGLDLNSSRSVEELDTLNLNHRVVLDELESYKSKVKLAESSNQQYLSTLEQLQKTLGVTNSRIEEVEKFWNQSKNESEMNRNLTIELNRELEGRLQELNQAQSRTEELERLLESLKEENESLRTLNEKGISELVETTNAKTLEFQNGDSQARLTESRTRNMALERDLMSANRREFDLKEKNRLIEAAEVKASAANGAADDIGSRSAEFYGGFTLDKHRKRTTNQESSRASKSIRPAESIPEGTRTTTGRNCERDTNSGGEIALLVEEVQRLRSGGASSGKVEEELQALQERHRTLESTHIKAVQYVKGTEKMLRRMKEELSKYKEKTEQLELELSRARQQSPPLMMRDRMNELNGQIESLRMSSKRSTLEQEELKTKMSLLKQEYESSIEKLENEKIEEVMRVKESIKILENENMELREDLKKFIGKFGRDNVGDGNNKISRGTGSGDGDGKDGEDAELRFKELKKQSEVLRKENLELQNRCSFDFINA